MLAPRTWYCAASPIHLRLWKADGGLKTGELETRSKTAQLKRAARATANATPEPVAKGADTVYYGNATTGVATSAADYVDVL
jgi:hypothetical protein